MNIDKFLKCLNKLISYKIKCLVNERGSFYGDIRSAYDSESKDDFKLYKQKYIDYFNNKITINTFELTLLDIEFDIDNLKCGDFRFKYMLDIASAFEGYDEFYSLPFYTMLKFNAVFNAYKTPLIIKLSACSDLDVGLFSRAKTELLTKAANDFEKELTFLLLTAS